MRLMIRMSLCLLAAQFLSWATPAKADRRLVGDIGAITIEDNVVIPKNKTCTLSGTTIEGNVSVAAGATLVADNARVSGHLQAAGAKAVTLRASIIGGSARLVGTGRSEFNLDSTTIAGNLALLKGSKASIAGGGINGHLTVSKITGPFTLEAVTLSGSLRVERLTGALTLDGSELRGNLTIERQRGAARIDSCSVRGNARISKHAGGDFNISLTGFEMNLDLTQNSSLVRLDASTVAGDLISSKNQPPPVLSRDSNVEGRIIGPVEQE